MDLIVIYSNYSPACRELFELFPHLTEKAVCADNAAFRGVVTEQLKVAAVPTLLVVEESTILRRVVGVDRIRNWLWMLSNEIEPPQAPPPSPSLLPAQVEMGEGKTNLFPSDEIMPQVMKPAAGSVKSMAEEMQREREQQLKSLNENVK